MGGGGGEKTGKNEGKEPKEYTAEEEGKRKGRKNQKGTGEERTGGLRREGRRKGKTK